MARFHAASVPQWSDRFTRKLESFITDLHACVDAMKTNQEQADLAARWFLSWAVCQSENGNLTAQVVLRAPSGDRPHDLSDGEYTKAVVDVVSAWRSHVVTNGMFSPTTRAAYFRRLAAIFEALGAGRPDRYPRFPSGLVSVRTLAGDVSTLGELGWPECDGLTGPKQEQFCLDLLREDAIEVVEAELALAELGQTILSGVELAPGLDPRALERISQLFRNERSSFQTTGFSSFTSRGDNSWLGDQKLVFREYSNIQLWHDAGFSDEQVECLRCSDDKPPFMLAGIYRLLHPCLGPTVQLVKALGIAFECETGWNAQPTFTMPRDPFIGGVDGGTGVCGFTFLESFKRRAGKFVLARLDGGLPLPEQRMTALWKATRTEVDPARTNDGHAILRDSPVTEQSTLRLLKRYERIADAARSLDRSGIAAERFFFALTRHKGVVVGLDFVMPRMGASRPLGRPGVGARAIRKSRINCRYDKVRSIAALGDEFNCSPGTLRTYYLSTQDVRRRHEESIRFFQAAVQSVVLDRLDGPAVELVMPAEDRVWFRRLATLAGVSSAMGIERDAPDDDATWSTMRFYPTPTNLRDLYLAHRGIRQSRSAIGHKRWLVQAIPLLASIKAIRRRLVEQGFLPAYIREARQAQRELDAGLILIPPVLES